MIIEDWLEMEEAAAAAWPAPWSERHHSFELRASPEDSNRANSIRLLCHRVDVDQMICVARPFFSRHGRAVQVAVPQPFHAMDRALARRGLVVTDPSLYMRRLAETDVSPPVPVGTRVQIDVKPVSSWLTAWSICAELSPNPEEHFRLVRSSRGRSQFVSLYDDSGTPLAVGSTISNGRWRCFANLATRKDLRRRGLGSLVLTILTAQRAPHVEWDFLQVDEGNPAVTLYRAHGFKVAYPYHYRREVQQPSQLNPSSSTSK